MVDKFVALSLWGGGMLYIRPDQVVAIKEGDAGTSMIITGFNVYRVAQGPEEVMRRIQWRQDREDGRLKAQSRYSWEGDNFDARSRW